MISATKITKDPCISVKNFGQKEMLIPVKAFWRQALI
jgi:hypothetical protein